VNDLTATKINNLDLNGIQFLDTPWKLLPKDDLGEAVVNAWPAASGALGPFFAMGMDSYNLMPRLKQLREFPNTRFYGATGTITISEQSLIRELTWATMVNGEVQVANYAMESSHDS
jgi:outer membrane PBP1 activator LpoA protein